MLCQTILSMTIEIVVTVFTEGIHCAKVGKTVPSRNDFNSQGKEPAS